MAISISDQTTALAATIQFLKQVRDIALGKDIDAQTLLIPVNAIFATSPASAVDVYSGLKNIQEGLYLFSKDILKNTGDPESVEIIRMFLMIIHLEKKASKDSNLLNGIAVGIKRSKSQAEYFDSKVHDSVIAGLGDLYSKTISTLSPRIMIRGDSEKLKDPKSIATIRMLLMAAIRSAILWKQCGGSKLKIIFSRKRYVETATYLLEQAKSEY